MIDAKVIADSVSGIGARIVTLQLVYPRFIHAEFMTHRVFSRNASSSRAIPVAKMVDMVRNNPAAPVHWGKNQPGMQANEQLDDEAKIKTMALWLNAAKSAADHAEQMMKMGVHKQVANRILEPFQHIHVVMTATEFDNFFELRAHPDAQPEIQELAVKMRTVMELSKPVLRQGSDTSLNGWHLPYILEDERNDSVLTKNPINLLKMSAARCARVSYLRHDGVTPSVQDDLDLYDRLVGSAPIHASPIEHQARAMLRKNNSGNLSGWAQFRKFVETDMMPSITP